MLINFIVLNYYSRYIIQWLYRYVHRVRKLILKDNRQQKQPMLQCTYFMIMKGLSEGWVAKVQQKKC